MAEANHNSNGSNEAIQGNGNGANASRQENNTPPEKEPAVREPIEVKINEAELEQLKRDALEYKDKYLRLLAEMENARKRLQKERQEISAYAIQSTVIDFLPPMDNLENALKFAQQMSEETKQWATGFQMILVQFKDALANNGISPVASQGTTFDPHMHEAVETVETDKYPPGTIVEECSRGYKMGDRTIRPARVKVAKTPAEPNKS